MGPGGRTASKTDTTPQNYELRAMSPSPSRITVPKFTAMKAEGRKIAVMTAYDYTMASLVDGAGVDAVLVGDSLGMVVQGHDNTLPVTLDQMIYHAEMVGRAVQRALVIVDLPFPTFHLGPHRAVENAARILQQTRCQAVKLEGGVDQAETIAALVTAGIPVMAHCGLRPQSVHQLGGYAVQRDSQPLVDDAKAAEQAGAFAVVLECISAEIASQITATLRVPTIGIGAGIDCDGQVLVLNDLLGLGTGHVPRHVKRYANLNQQVLDAVTRYCEEVRSGTFPGPDQTFH